MRYTESQSKCAEYLRLLIPFLSKHKLAPNPVNYAVCFQYISNRNRELNEAIDTELEANGVLSESVFLELYEKFIASDGEKKIAAQYVEFARLYHELSESADEADQQANHFNQSLQSYEGELEGELEKDTVHRIVGDLVTDTKTMQASVSNLQEQLNERKCEIDNLRTKLLETQEEVYKDSLTGMFNRKGFDLAFEKANSNALPNDNPLCLLMVDIDHFKRVNDNYGHLVGDKVIQIVGSMLNKHIKGKDTASRFGGEEFAVLLPDTSLSGAGAVAENIRRAMENSRIVKRNSKEPIETVTISIGVAQQRADEPSEDLISRADAALYESKNQGRNRVTVDE